MSFVLCCLWSLGLSPVPGVGGASFAQAPIPLVIPAPMPQPPGRLTVTGDRPEPCEGLYACSESEPEGEDGGEDTESFGLTPCVPFPHPVSFGDLEPDPIGGFSDPRRLARAIFRRC